MSEDSPLEEDIWEYKSIRKLKSVNHYSESISENVQKTNDEKGKSQSGNRKPPKEKETPKAKQGSRRRGSQTPLKSEQCYSVSSDDPVVSSQESLLPSSAKQKKNKKMQSPSKPRPVYEGYCPSCQMPFSLLLIETPQWHVTECLESSKTAEQECLDGLLCTSIIPSHYKRYSHFLLATSRAGENLPEFSPANTDNNFFKHGASPSISCSAYNFGVSQDPNDSQNMGKLPKECLLFPKQSSTVESALDVTSKEAYYLENTEETELRIHSVNGAGQLWCHSPLRNLKSQQDSYQLNTLVSENDLSDSYISYSPLNTDGEETIVKEEEEDVVVKEKELVAGKTNQLKKKLFDIRNTEDKSREVLSFLSHKPLGASKPNQFEPGNVKKMQTCTINNESCKTLHTIESADGISNSVSQDTEARILNLTNIFDPLKESTEKHSFPLKYKRPKETFESLKLSSSSLNIGECGWGSSNDCNLDSADSAAIFALITSELKEGVKPFLPCQRDILKKSSSCLNSEDKTVTGTCKNSLAFNSFCSLTEKGGFSNNTTMPITHSPDSEMLPCVSGANPQVQNTSAKELKQMDIGVFFGLQAKAKLEDDQKKNLQGSTKLLGPTATTGRRPRSQKRKAKGSVEDSDVVTESSSNNTMPAYPASGPQKRWRKRFKESCPGEEETRKKLCPFYKKIPGTDFVVDAFQYGEIEGCKAYFLTHFHSDHYGGLTKKFTFPIYCNQITGNLVKCKLQVPEQYIHILPMDTECIINGIKVVLLDANHCPGAAMILFSLPNGTVILHTGDFRADPSMERYTFLTDQKVHSLYLDTTYCNPEYTFPSQQEVIQFAVNTAFETVTLNPRTLVVCGTYSVGKEKVFLAIADVLGSKVSMSKEKYKTLQCLESAAINSLITLDWNNTLLHLLPMMQINFRNLQSHLNKFGERFDQILAFKPTGWTYSEGCCSLNDIQPQTRGKITIYGIPYSEHSSFLEMKRFVQWLKPQKIIPTVNVGNWKLRNEMEKHFRNWKMEAAGWN
uniref:DNA cross-link repair 1A protein isoform X1 n=2 Tax=Pogona vitticeps TaxID=103695 RepID=A0A6J0SGX8_9SAUR